MAKNTNNLKQFKFLFITILILFSTAIIQAVLLANLYSWAGGVSDREAKYLITKSNDGLYELSRESVSVDLEGRVYKLPEAKLILPIDKNIYGSLGAIFSEDNSSDLFLTSRYATGLANSMVDSDESIGDDSSNNANSNYESCLKPVHISFGGDGVYSDYKFLSSKKLDDGRTAYISYSTTCEQDSLDFAKYAEKINSY